MYFHACVLPEVSPGSILSLVDWNAREQVTKKERVIQSSQVKHTPQDFINEFIIHKLNALVVADFKFFSTLLHV